MTNFKKITPLLLGVVFILSGCSLGKETEEQDTLTAIKDKEFLTTAYTQKSLETCDLIEDKSLQDDCKINVEGTLLLQDAKQKGDKSLCEKIAVSDLKASCEISFKEKENQSEKIAELEKLQTQDRQNAEAIIKSGNLDACKSLNSPYDITCFDSIIDNQAISKKDKSICQKHGEQELITQCEELVSNDNPSN